MMSSRKWRTDVGLIILYEHLVVALVTPFKIEIWTVEGTEAQRLR